MVSIRRKYVFAQLKPTTNSRIDLGLALRGVKVPATLIETGGLAKDDRKVQQTARVDIQLTIGELAESVIVTADQLATATARCATRSTAPARTMALGNTGPRLSYAKVHKLLLIGEFLTYYYPQLSGKNRANSASKLLPQTEEEVRKI